MQSTIVVVGSINMDLIFRTPRMPAVGETISGYEFVQVAGGKGANQAVAAARQGAATSLIASVGRDLYGQQALRGLKAEGIVTDFIHPVSDVASGVAGIFVDDHGNNSIVVAPGANAHLTPQHIDVAKAVISQADLLICQCETPLATVTAAIELAFAHGVDVLFNPAPALPLPDELLTKVKYLTVNEIEATQLSGVQVVDIPTAQAAATQLLARGPACVQLTLGEHGVCVAQKTENNTIQHHHMPAIRVKVVDTTAAGDTFVGALGCAIGRGLSILDATNEAQFAAALTVTKLGAQSSIPHREEVLRLMADTKNRAS